MKAVSNTRVVVVGNGMVGYKFCEKLLSRKKTDRILPSLYLVKNPVLPMTEYI